MILATLGSIVLFFLYLAVDSAENNNADGVFVWWCFSFTTFIVLNSINIYLHANFVLQYWVLSRKLKALLDNKDDFDRLRKHYIMIVALITLAQAGAIAICIWSYT